MLCEQLHEGRHRDVQDVSSPPLHGDRHGRLVLQPSAAEVRLKRPFGGKLQPREALLAPSVAEHELALVEDEPQLGEGKRLAGNLGAVEKHKRTNKQMNQRARTGTATTAKNQ